MYVALDLGGTKIMVATFTADGKIIKREKVDTPKPLAEGLELIKKLVHDISGDSKIFSIGASAGGPLD